MKVSIPKEYLGHFQEDIAFLTWWKKPTLLLMNKDEKESFQETLEKGVWIRFAEGCEWSPLCMPIVELVIEDGIISIPTPEDPRRRLRGKNRVFTSDRAGIVLS
ncbi:hypothetical protein HQ403_02525 [Candidatus Kaiserbacteria bacterium]|nr:hypothetical protein [Candidatus Kaiserbacteria bacterium]